MARQGDDCPRGGEGTGQHDGEEEQEPTPVTEHVVTEDVTSGGGGAHRAIHRSCTIKMCI